MDKSINSLKSPFFDISIYSISGYSVVLSLLVLFVMLVMFFRKKVNQYMNKRNKLHAVYEEYDRKRECRNGLRVSDAIKFNLNYYLF